MPTYSGTLALTGQADVIDIFTGKLEFFDVLFIITITATADVQNGLNSANEHIVILWTSTATNWGVDSGGHYDATWGLRGDGQTINLADSDYHDSFITVGGGDWIDIVDFRLTETLDANSNLAVHVVADAIVSGTLNVGTVLAGDFTLTSSTATSVSINDVSVFESNSGNKVMNFVVTRNGGATSAFDVNFATSNGTATVADSDYLANSGVLHFGANEVAKTVSMTVRGDTKIESDENFFVTLSGATNGVTISDSAGLGTIVNDDGPGSVSINDVSVAEGNGGTKTAVFTVTRTGGFAAFSVNYATANGSATVADTDYAARSGTLSFGVGVDTQTIAITINGDTKVEPSENFLVLLSGGTNSISISDGSGVGTIADDDAFLHRPPSDFNGDARSDILLQNVKTGNVFVWQMNGTALAGNGGVGWTPGAAWQAKDTEDYNGDGRADVLLQNVDTGDCYVWLVNGTSLAGNGAVGWTPGAAWQARDGGDFNGDGRGDVLLQNVNTGACYIWELNGTSLVGNGSVGWTPGAAWQAKATGDFNGDGKSDIVLQNVNTGDCYIWELNDTSLVGNGAVGWTPGAAWQVKAAGDYNGDGKSDILLQNANTGDCYIWALNGTSLVGNGAAGWTPGAAWQAKDGGDFNGDGKSDILLQNVNTGDAYMWLMNGTSLIGNGPAGWTPGADWHIL